MSKIEEEIRQKAFKSEYHKAHVNILFTAARLIQQSAVALKPYQLSWQQFNILRILKGMDPEPATVKLLTERMIDKMSNASRLVDKLKAKGYVEREACEEDRRRVNIRLTDTGRQLLEQASHAMENMTVHRSDSLTEEEVIQLNDLLNRIRG